jgi:hypothetical protein
MSPIVEALTVLDQEPKFFGKLVDNVHDYLTWESIEYCLNNPQYYLIEIIKNGQKLNIPKNKNVWHDEPVDDKKFIFDNINQGNAFVILNYSYYNLVTTQLMKELADKFDVFPDIHAYGGLEGSGSFNIHKDYPPNIIVQVYGETPWKIWKDLTEPPVIDLVLKPGEVLYVPGGLYHVAIPVGQRVSMSIPCWPNINLETTKQTDRNFYRINHL